MESPKHSRIIATEFEFQARQVAHGFSRLKRDYDEEIKRLEKRENKLLCELEEIQERKMEFTGIKTELNARDDSTIQQMLTEFKKENDTEGRDVRATNILYQAMARLEFDRSMLAKHRKKLVWIS